MKPYTGDPENCAVAAWERKTRIHVISSRPFLCHVAAQVLDNAILAAGHNCWGDVYICNRPMLRGEEGWG